jgi:hypothetical protein
MIQSRVLPDHDIHISLLLLNHANSKARGLNRRLAMQFWRGSCKNSGGCGSEDL